jgi:pyruvate dehydrogenase E2 component (dihydrolipoamide acetyltransferase)
LYIPVIENCDKKNLLDISNEVKNVVCKIRELGFLKQRGTPPCTFTVTNLGMFNVKNFFGIINEPNSGILAVSSIVEKLKIVSGRLAKYPFIKLTLSGDHRLLDGVSASKFLNKIKFLIENPYLISLY